MTVREILCGVSLVAGGSLASLRAGFRTCSTTGPCRKPCSRRLLLQRAASTGGILVGDPRSRPAGGGRVGRHRPRPLPSATTPARRDCRRYRATSTWPTLHGSRASLSRVAGGVLPRCRRQLDRFRRWRSPRGIGRRGGGRTAWRGGPEGPGFAMDALPMRDRLDLSTTSRRLGLLGRAAGHARIARPEAQRADGGLFIRRGSP